MRKKKTFFKTDVPQTSQGPIGRNILIIPVRKTFKFAKNEY